MKIILLSIFLSISLSASAYEVDSLTQLWQLDMVDTFKGQILRKKLFGYGGAIIRFKNEYRLIDKETSNGYFYLGDGCKIYGRGMSDSKDENKIEFNDQYAITEVTSESPLGSVTIVAKNVWIKPEEVQFECNALNEYDRVNDLELVLSNNIEIED